MIGVLEGGMVGLGLFGEGWRVDERLAIWGGYGRGISGRRGVEGERRGVTLDRMAD